MIRKSFRLGLLVRADKTGLGYQTKAYYDFLKPDKTLLIDLSPINGMQSNYDWYPNAEIVVGLPRRDQLAHFLYDIDVLLTAETFYNYELISIARQRNIKTAVVYNYEFFDWLKHQDYPLPDLFISPSTWYFKEVDRFSKLNKVKHLYLHHPVDRDRFKFRKRETKKFLHIAGRPAANDRNGTWDYLYHIPDGRLVTQDNDLAIRARDRYRHSEVYTGIDDPAFIYELGDILVLPRRYGGNCLPLNEALSCGMPVIMPDISPNNYLLPKEWLVPANINGYFEPRTKIDLWTVNSQAFLDRIDWFRNCNIEVESEKANKIADTISWEAMLPKWIQALNDLK